MKSKSFSARVTRWIGAARSLYDLVLIDYRINEMNGIDCLTQLRAMPQYQSVPIIILTADDDCDLRLNAVKIGTTDFLNKPFDPGELRVRATNLLSLREAQLALMDRARLLDHEAKQATRKLVVREEELIWRLSRAIETRDRATGEHISRLAAIEKIIAQQPGLDKNYCHTPYLATPLHDAGKIGGGDAVLNKPGKLTREERKEIERHTEIAANILQGDENDLIRMAHEIALSHHEKWDGTGHRRGLAGEDIPLSGRIAAVADEFDVPCSDRAHKDAWPFDDAVEEVLQHSGTHFDPKCVSAFKTGIAEIRKLYTAQPADLLIGTDLQPDQTRSALTIRRSGHILLDMISDILDYSSLSTNGITSQNAPVSLVE